MIPTRYINAGPMPAQMNAAPAMAAGKALENVGNAISQVANTGLDLIERKRKMVEGAKINAFIADADQQAADFAIGLARRSDTDAWSQEWKEKSAAMLEKGKALGLSPDGQAHFENRFTNWNSDRSINFQTQAASKELGMAQAQTIQSLEYFRSRGMKAEHEATLATAEATGVIDPVKGKGERIRYAESEATLDMQRMVDGNPQGVVDMPAETFLKTMPGATLEMVDQAKRQAKGAVKERSRDAGELAMDEIADNKLLDPKQLKDDPRFAAMRPALRAHMEGVMQERAAEGYREKVAMPEFQQELASDISAGISNYNPEDENADLHLAQIDSAMAEIKPGHLKDKLTKQYKDLLDSRAQPEAKTYGEVVAKQITALYDAGHFTNSVKPGKIPLKKFVDDGFLKDPEKLQRLGFSEDQAGVIVTEAKQDPALGQGKLSELWNQRDAGNVKASEDEIAVANGLRLGHPNSDFNTPAGVTAAAAAEVEGKRKHGLAVMQFDEFLRTNPAAKKEEIDKEFKRITGASIREEEKAKKIPPRPTPGGGDKSTSGLDSRFTAPLKEFWAQFPGTRMTSGYRSPEHNAMAGGAKHSKHIEGIAVDINVANLGPEQRLAAFEFWARKGAKGFGYYNNQGIHVDFRDTATTWGPNHSSSSVPTTPKWFQQFSANLLAGKYASKS